MSDEESTGQRSGSSQREPHRVRLPGFISDEKVGLGELVKKATSMVGIRPCGGCAERAKRLDNWMVFSRRR
jgi:hypothetical protein